MARPDLDRWLPGPVIETFHRREARASEADLWRAAGTVRLADSRVLGRLVRWRIPGSPARSTYRQLFRNEPFMLLEAGEGYSLSGLVGRIWTLRRDYPVLAAPDEFRRFDRAGSARVLFAHWVEAGTDARSVLVSAVRVDVTDGRARTGLRIVRPLVRAFEQLIGSEALTIAVRLAEAEGGARRSPRPTAARRD